MQSIDFLAIGHVCHDWSEEGNVLGGTTSYASFFARKMNLQTAILTSFGSDFEFQNRLHLDRLPLIFDRTNILIGVPPYGVFSTLQAGSKADNS